MFDIDISSSSDMPQYVLILPINRIELNMIFWLISKALYASKYLENRTK